MPVIIKQLTDFSNGLRSDLLQIQLRGYGLAQLQAIGTSDNEVTFTLSSDLTDSETITFNAVCAAHVGKPFVPKFYVATSIKHSVFDVTEDQNWQEVGAAIANPSFFIPNLAYTFGQLLGEVAIDGTGAQVRILEFSYLDSETTTRLPATDLSDTGAAWALLSKTTDYGGKIGHCRFTVEARKNGASSLKFRYLTMSLLELV